MPGRAAVDEEQRRPLALGVRHHDVDRRDVAVGDEPLLAVDHPAAVAPPRGRRDAGRVRARVLLGHRVGVVELAAQRRAQPAVDLLGRPAARARCRRSGTCHESALVERPNCSSTSTHSSFVQPCPPCSRRVQPAVQLGRHRLGLDPLEHPPPAGGPRRARPAPRAGSARPRRTAARGAWSSACSGVSSVSVERDAHARGASASTGAWPLRDAASRARSRFHRWSCRIRLAALWPPAAITPPPGCVPGAAEVQAVDRRRVLRERRRRAHERHLVEPLLALEDVAAEQAEDALEVGRGEHLVVHDRVAHVRRDRRRACRGTAARSARASPRASPPRCRGRTG